jgi:hypothetical protein
MSTDRPIPEETLLAAAVILVSGKPALAECPVTSVSTIIDRAEIEDMLIYKLTFKTESFKGKYHS